MSLDPLRKHQIWLNPPNVVLTTSEGILMTEGYAEKSDTDGLAGFIFIITVIIILGLGIVMLWWSWWFWLVIGLFLLLIAFFARKYIYARWNFFPGELTVLTYPLHLGELCTITFHRRLKRNRKTTREMHLNLKVACVEQIEFVRKDNATFKSVVIWESTPVGFTVSPGVDALSFETQVFIPSHLPPSFESKHNHIRWGVIVEQPVAGVVKEICSEFTLLVNPVVIS